MHKIILGSIEALHELVQFIQQLDEQDYQQGAEPLFQQTIASHVDRILNRYQALMQSEHNQIDYSVSRDTALIEMKRFQGLKELVDIENWLMSLDINEFQTVKIVNINVCLSISHYEKLTSTLARELSAASAYVTQQLAMMQAIGACQRQQKKGL